MDKVMESIDQDYPIIHNIDWSKSHNGVMLCSFDRTKELMPEVTPILDELLNSDMLELNPSQYSVDVKIHMLMPGTYPCIPNWHRDFMPRDENGERCPGRASDLSMYMWLSGPPLTEYMRKDGTRFQKSPQMWHKFTQHDLHRGVMSTQHCWRCFIRVIPTEFIHKTTINAGQVRRHTQVYIPDPEKFTW